MEESLQLSFKPSDSTLNVLTTSDLPQILFCSLKTHICSFQAWNESVLKPNYRTHPKQNLLLAHCRNKH